MPRWEPRTRLGRRIAEDEKRATEAHPDDPGHWDLPAWAFLVVVAACVGYAVMTVLITDALGVSSRVGEAFAWTGGAAILAAGGRRFARRFGTRPK